MKIPKKPTMDWIRGKKLGNGSFATVSIAENKRDSSNFPKLMAVKSCGVYQSSSLLKEKLILEELKGCNEIIQCFGDSHTFENGEKLYNVLLEYASGGALSEKVKNSGDHLPEVEVRRYTKALLKGLLYIHKAGYVHCDIKLQNILLDHNGGLKIADFGLAKRVGSKEVGFPKWELRGTLLYMSPETVNGGELAPPADIWAAGCAVAEMITGAPAWKYTDLAELLMKIGVGDEVPEIPCCLSEQGRDFLERCFVKDPIKRWTAEMLLRHPFVCGDDQEFDDMLKEKVVSSSPRCPFDFVSEVTSSITSLSSPEYSREPSSWFSDASEFRREPWCSSAAERLRGLVSDQGPNWSVSEDWVTIR